MLNIPFDRFKGREKLSPILSSLGVVAGSLTGAEARLSQENLSKFGEGDCAEIIRGGSCHRDLPGKSTNSINDELRATKGYSAKEIEALVSLCADLYDKGFSALEA